MVSKDDMKKKTEGFMADENFELNSETLDNIAGGYDGYVDTYYEESRPWKRVYMGAAADQWDTYKDY